MADYLVVVTTYYVMTIIHGYSGAESQNVATVH